MGAVSQELTVEPGEKEMAEGKTLELRKGRSAGGLRTTRRNVIEIDAEKTKGMGKTRKEKELQAAETIGRKKGGKKSKRKNNGNNNEIVDFHWSYHQRQR